MKRFAAVAIEWTDTTYEHEGWTPLDDYDTEKLPNDGRITTIGYVVHADKKSVHVCQSIDAAHTTAMAFICIPRGCISRIRTL